MADQQRHIVIIGGGIIGCSTAYFLTRHPSYDPSRHKVTVLEASQIAGGASGKAGGLLALWAYPSNIVPLSYRLHAELAKEHNGAQRWGYREVNCGQLVAQGRSFERTDSSAGKPKGAGEAVSLQKRSGKAMETLKAAGIPADLDWFDAEALDSYEEMGGPGSTAQVHPYLFTTSMAKLAEEKGANIVLGAVSKINQSAGKVESVTYTEKDTGNPQTISATDVILSAGPWTRTVYPSAPISALRAHSVVVRPTRPVSAYTLFTEIALPAGFGKKKKSAASVVTPEIYARPDETVYACGEGDRLVPLPKTTADVQVDQSRCQDIIDNIGSISEELREGEVVTRQACYLPNVSAGNGHPFVGPTSTTGLYIAAGHTCWGIQNAPGTGKVMSEFVFDGKAVSARVDDLDPKNYL